MTRAGRALLDLRLPGPGTLRLRGREIRTVTREESPEAGVAGIFLHLRLKARRRLTTSGHVRLAIEETFAPNGGTPASETKTVNFKEGKR